MVISFALYYARFCTQIFGWKGTKQQFGTDRTRCTVGTNLSHVSFHPQHAAEKDHVSCAARGTRPRRHRSVVLMQVDMGAQNKRGDGTTWFIQPK